ncbi:MAG TPA: RecX family transcriptional regulator [Candidatus Saccharimonadales bacterium]|nr:RecX family transcriptional regulator [Candidatus Saccharimonadales bacterium]
MKITAIKAQVKNPERVSVYVDEKYAFSLTHTQLLDSKIHSGLEIDDAKLAELKKMSEFGKAYGRILNYVMIRPRSHKEVEDYCWRKKITPEDCRVIIEKLAKRGYINDASFARSWIESRRLTKASSQRKLRMELRHKGVSDDAIQEAFAHSEYDELAALQEVITKKRRLSRFQDDQKLLQYLIRQGFSYDAARQALKATLPEE